MNTLTSSDKTTPSHRPPLEGAAAVIGEKVDHARERVTELARHARERIVDKENEFEDYVCAHPVKSVLAAAGIGAGLGLVLGALFARR